MRGVRLVLRGLHDTFENLAYCAIVSLFWWVCQLLIVTGPAATIALFVHADPRHGTVTDRPSLEETLQLVRRNLWSGWRLILLALPVEALLVYNVGYYTRDNSVLSLATPLWVALLFLSPTIIRTAVAHSALDGRGAIDAYKASFRIVGGRLPTVLVILVLLAVILPIGAVLVIPLAMFLPSTVAAIFNRLVLTSLRLEIPDPLAPTVERVAEGNPARRRIWRP
jgi:hypothetical protein